MHFPNKIHFMMPTQLKEKRAEDSRTAQNVSYSLSNDGVWSWIYQQQLL